MKNRIVAGALSFVFAAGAFGGTSHSQTLGDNLTLKGDLRYRHETIDQENADGRNQERIRARVNLAARISDRLNVVVGLATGAADDPVSANQTLTGGFSDKPFWLDLAYADWNPANGLHLIGGKMKNPFYLTGRNQIIWDHDLNPEGFALQFARKTGPVETFATGAVFLIQERAVGDDSYMAGAQAGIRGGTDIAFTAGAGFLEFANSEDVPTFYNPDRSSGNTVNPDDTYAFGFRNVEAFGELSLNTLPASPLLHVEVVTNIAGDVEEDLGWSAGLTLGRLKAPGSWSVRYQYVRLEADAVVGAFTNSDFIGGGTNGKGHIFGVDYQISAPVGGALTYYLNQRGIEDGLEYHRFQADLNIRF